MARVYIETCPLIDVIKDGTGVATDPALKDDIWYTQTLLRAALDGKVQVFTSTLTIAECKRAEQAKPASDEAKRLINSILTSGRIILLAQVTQGIAELARDLEWVHGINLKGADAIHVATAITLKCEEFLTLDGRGPIKHAAKITGKFKMNMARPSATLYLPSEYKQHKLIPTT